MSLSQNCWINAANTLLERTLDDSANRHIVIADAFLATDEILILYTKIQAEILVNKENLSLIHI